MRVYKTPRRFLGCYVPDWESRLLSCDAAYVVVDKPAMLPCQPDNSNSAECVPACAAAGLREQLLGRGKKVERGKKKSSKNRKGGGHDDQNASGGEAGQPPEHTAQVQRGTPPPPPLLLVHRLDTCTEGCMVLARNGKAQAAFNGWLRRHKVHKEYLCLHTAPVEQGIKTHHMLHGDFAAYNEAFGPGPRLLRRSPPPHTQAQTQTPGDDNASSSLLSSSPPSWSSHEEWMEWK